jgi:hypothetical protein
MQLTRVGIAAGALQAKTAGNDPAFFGPPLQARARESGAVKLRMKLQREDQKPFRDTAQLFWRTSQLSESEATSVRFEVIGDGQWRDYWLPVSKNLRWRGIITRLRLDPCAQPQVLVELDFIRLAPN